MKSKYSRWMLLIAVSLAAVWHFQHSHVERAGSSERNAERMPVPDAVHVPKVSQERQES